MTISGGQPHRLGYARVSTSEQELDLQVDALAAAGCGRIWCDRGVSGAKSSRPAWDDLRRQLRPGDHLVVWRLDRAGRSLRHLLDLAAELQAADVELVSLREAIDTSTPAGRLTFQLLGALAEFERELAKERSAAGVQAAVARGARIGRPQALTADQRALARQLVRDEHQSTAAVARLLGVGRATVGRALTREVPA
ncbi:MAG TPA: recombinase family protein [Friedmanniella sp.]